MEAYNQAQGREMSTDSDHRARFEGFVKTLTLWFYSRKAPCKIHVNVFFQSFQSNKFAFTSQNLIKV